MKLPLSFPARGEPGRNVHVFDADGVHLGAVTAEAAEYLSRVLASHLEMVTALRIIGSQAIGPDYPVEEAAEFMKKEARSTLRSVRERLL